MKIIPFNPDERISVEKFRCYPGCESYTSEQALNAVKTIELLAIILFDFVCHKNGIPIDNQLVIPLFGKENDLNKAA